MKNPAFADRPASRPTRRPTTASRGPAAGLIAPDAGGNDNEAALHSVATATASLGMDLLFIWRTFRPVRLPCTPVLPQGLQMAPISVTIGTWSASRALQRNWGGPPSAWVMSAWYSVAWGCEMVPIR
jgi:hypothetical protein